MALYTVSVGGAIQSADLNQLVNLLTGTTQGTLTTLGGGLTLNNATSNLLACGAGVGGPNTSGTSTGEKVRLYDGGGGTVSSYTMGVDNGILWQNVGSGNAFKWAVAGGYLLTLNASGLTATGQIYGHTNYACIEAGDGTQRHIEVYP